MFVLVYKNCANNVKRFDAGKSCLPKGTIKNKNVYDQAIKSDPKRYEETRKVTTGQGEDYTTECLLVYEYIKNHYRLLAVDLGRQKELNADPKAIKQIEIVGKLKNLDDDGNAAATSNDQSMFVLTILEKINETRTTFSQGSITVL